jgi:G protein beta subunit-like protein
MPSVLLATGGLDFSLKFFDAASGACLRSFTHAERQINALAISPDRAYVVAGGHPLIRLYDVAGKSADPLVAYEGHSSNVTAVGWQRDGRWLFSGGEDGSVRIWDPRASGSQRDYDARAAVHSVALHPNQAELISADHSGTLRVWDLAAGKCAAELCPEVDSPLSSVGIAADASIVVAANFNGSVFCWRPRSGDEHEFVPLKRLNVRRR